MENKRKIEEKVALQEKWSMTTDIYCRKRNSR